MITLIFLCLMIAIIFAFLSFVFNLLLTSRFNRRTNLGLFLTAFFGGVLSASTFGYATLPSNSGWFAVMFILGFVISGSAVGLLVSQLVLRQYYFDHVEIRQLEKKLILIERQIAKVAENLKQDRLNEPARESLLEADRFLKRQERTISLRIRVLEYVIWERDTFSKYKKYLNLDYLKKNVNFKSLRRRLRGIISDARKQKDSLMLLSYAKGYSNTEIETVREIQRRASALVVHFDTLLTDLAQYEALRTVKSVGQVEAAPDVRQLPESNLADTINIINQFNATPLDRELLFQNLRVKSLSELQNDVA